MSGIHMSSKKPTDTVQAGMLGSNKNDPHFGKEPTLYAILVGGLDLCQDHFRRKGSEDGQPEDDYDIGSNPPNRGDQPIFESRGSPVYHRKPSPYLTLPSPTSATSKTQMQSPTS